MDIKTLKEKIVSNTLSDQVLILKYSDNKFLCNQYVDEICKNKNLNKVYITTIEDAVEDYFGNNDTLYVIDVENFKEYPTEDYKNLVIICKSVPDNLTIDFTDMTKLLNWQIEDYVKYRVPGLEENEVIWLCQICKYDIFRLDQECKKLELFPVGAQKQIFRQLNEDNAYCDLTDLNIFNFTDALILKDNKKIVEMMADMDLIDIEPLAVVTILIKKFKQILAIQTNNQAYIKQLGMSDKQVWFLKSNQCGRFSNDKLISNLEFLTSIDYKLKSGNLDLSRSDFLSYITINLF